MPVRLASNEEPLAGYRLIERLGRGGFGEVWKVEAPGGLLKAMKFVFGDLDASDEDSRPAEQELKALKRVQTIRHPYVLSLERYDIIDGQLMIVMELADRNLWDRYRECRAQGLPGIPRDELLRYMEETAEALDLMNNHYQIQHLDVKPQNIFLVFSHVKVGDFGLAKLLERERATVTGGVTPVYAAPETFEGYVSRFSDQYSLAIVFQELLTGVRPFNGANTRQLLMQHISGTPDLAPLPSADRPFIARALSKKPDDRWPTCMEMIRALKLSGLGAPPSTPIAAKGRLQPPGDPIDSNQITRYQGGAGRLNQPQDPMKTQTPVPPYAGPQPSGSLPPGTPMPPLVTVGPSGQIVPRLVTPSPSQAGQGPAITLTRPQILQTGRMNTLGIAPPEKNGDGALFPALVIGVGNLGRVVVETLRMVVCDHFGKTDRTANLRYLCIDTDPEAATSPNVPPAASIGKQLVLARLNRPAHYMQKDSLPPVEPWLPPGSLYKISRNPGAADGVRAFGRLALFDNYRLIAQRIRQELEPFLTDELLLKTAEETKLGLRTNRPRVYIIAGLGGGTGGGMFLDLAFLTRAELRGLGYPRPEIVGVFLVPPADRATKSHALGNTFAALAELHHFQAKKTKYRMTFDKSDPPVQDADPPFARIAIQQLPRAVDPKQRQLAVGRAARALFNEILTPAGRVVDEVRDVYRNAFPSAVPTCQSFGLYRLTWPRAEVLAAATRRFAQRLLQRWASKDASAQRDAISKWLDTQWSEKKLTFEQIVHGFEDAAKNHLHEDPERVFDAFVDPLRTRTPSGPRLDANSVVTVLNQLLKLVGKPDLATDEPGSLRAALKAHYEALCKDAEGQLALMAVTFIEQPQYRLAGAEETVRQIEERLKRHVETLEPMHTDLLRDLKHSYSRLLQLLAGLSTGSGGWKATTELLDLLRAYPKKRLRLDILDLSLSTYRKLLGSTPEYLRDIGICRSGLLDMNAAIGAGVAAGGDPAGPGKLILPEGCTKLDDAADRFLSGLNPSDVLAFDHELQREVSRKFRGIAAVSLKPIEKGPPFRAMLLDRARTFLDGKLDSANPADVFFRNRTGGPEDYPLIGEAFNGAAPELSGYTGKKPDELTILAAPADENGVRLRELVATALPGIEFTGADLPDDIVFYREFPRLELTELPHFGEHGRAAVAALAESEHPIHARVDVAWELPGEPIEKAAGLAHVS
jgi:serine/threonine protein kinase